MIQFLLKGGMDWCDREREAHRIVLNLLEAGESVDDAATIARIVLG